MRCLCRLLQFECCATTRSVFFFIFTTPGARRGQRFQKQRNEKAACVLQQQILAEPLRTTTINGCIYQRLSFTLQDVTCSFSQLHHRHHFLKSFFRCFFPPPPSPVQFAQELRNKVWPSFRQAGGRLHPLGCLDFVPTNCHVNFMQVSYPKSTTSAGRTFSIRFGRKNSLFGLDPDQG